MRSHAEAIAWAFRRRHRWGLMALAAYFAVLATMRLLKLGPDLSLNPDDETIALLLVVPVTVTFLYLLAVFSFGLSGDLAARQSMYPARMFTLPVTNAALAGWPMLFGMGAMAVLWLATRLIAVWPPGEDIPIIWPALLAASLLAWTQALTWMPYALPGLRVVLTVLWLAAFDAVVLLALRYKVSEPVMLAILLPHVPLAYLTARYAVARARRGDVPDWRGVFARLGTMWSDARFGRQSADVLPRRRERFASPDRAQTWFEWRRHGRSLPALVGMLLPFELALLFVFSDTPVIVFEILAGVLVTPPLMAAFVAATVSSSNPHASDSHGLTPFIATRPLTSVSLIAAKLKATIWSTLAAWLLVIAAIPVAIRLSGTFPLVIDWTRDLVEAMGTPRAVAIVLIGFMGLVASTWKQLVSSLYIGMSGREWIVKASLFVTLSLLAILVPIAHWIVSDRGMMAALWNALPWIAALLVSFKLSAAVWIAMRLRDSRLISDRMLVIGAASWDVAVFALYGLLAWLLPALLFRSYFLALVAIVEVPLARLSAAPLALAWNRHR